MYVELSARAGALAAVLHEACADAGFAARFPVVGTLVGVVCGDVPPPVDFDGARRTDEKAYAALFHALLDEGVALAPGAYEAVFVGLAHDDAVIDQVGEAAERARCAVAAATPDRPGRGPRRYPDIRCGRCSRGGSLPRSGRWWGSPCSSAPCSSDGTRSPGSPSAADRPAGGPT